MSEIRRMGRRGFLGAGAFALGGALVGCETTGSGGGGGGGGLPPASKDSPFVNSLGMRFVPVPGTRVLMCTTETTVDQYVLCGRGYQTPGYPQEGNHPAVNVSWDDAKAWCAWLGGKEGRRYRLPTDAEWSAAVGIGHLEDARAAPSEKSNRLPGYYPWGRSWPPPEGAGNYLGQEHRGSAASVALLKGDGLSSPGLIEGFRDRHKFTAPVGSYGANALGIHDLGGNVWEWCEDWYDGSKISRVLRGGSWGKYAQLLLGSSLRFGFTPDSRRNLDGFRCVLG